MTGLTNHSFLIYRITNLLDGKVYIGKHKTRIKDDGYMGSGKLITRAIKKHGVENFRKEILFECSTEADMNALEAKLVTEEFCLRDDTYNLCPGGHGGWGYVKTLPRTKSWRAPRPRPKDQKTHGENISKALKLRHENDPSLREKICSSDKIEKMRKANLGAKRSDETRLQMSKSHSGSNNSQFGSIWINNGKEAKKIKGEIPDGWVRGRKF